MLEALKKLWDTMTPQQRAAKVKGLNDYTFYKSYCVARKFVEIDERKMTIAVLKNTKEVKSLIASLQTAGFTGFKISYQKKIDFGRIV